MSLPRSPLFCVLLIFCFFLHALGPPERDLNTLLPTRVITFWPRCRSRTPGARSGVRRDTSSSSARPPRRVASAASSSRRRTQFSPKRHQRSVVGVETVKPRARAQALLCSVLQVIYNTGGSYPSCYFVACAERRGGGVSGGPGESRAFGSGVD